MFVHILWAAWTSTLTWQQQGSLHTPHRGGVTRALVENQDGHHCQRCQGHPHHVVSRHYKGAPELPSAHSSNKIPFPWVTVKAEYLHLAKRKHTHTPFSGGAGLEKAMKNRF